MARNPDEYEKVVISTDGLYSASRSLKEECDYVRDTWRNTMKSLELPIFGGGFRQLVGESGRIVLAWFKGQNERIYYVIYDPTEKKIIHHRKEKP